MASRTRKRTWRSKTTQQEKQLYANPPTFTSQNFDSHQEMTDSTHNWPLYSERLGDVGGAMTSFTYKVEVVSAWVKCASFNGVHKFKGDVIAQPIGGSSGASSGARVTHWKCGIPPFLQTAELIALGATAISRCAPTNPHASVAQALGELRRDGIPSLPALLDFQKMARPKKAPRYKPTRSQAARKKAAKTGSEYLNVEFGIKPILNDFRKILTSVQESEKILRRYRQGSGKLIRRRYEFPTESSVSVVDYGQQLCSSVCIDGWLVPKGHSQEIIKTVTRKWFSGAFTYHVAHSEEIQGLGRFAQEANHLFGVGITPGVVWDLTPWSWATDWFVNTGDVLNNVSMMQTDGLVVVWGYMMAETTITRTVTNYGATPRGNPPLDLKIVWTTKVQQRIRATPFGFGLDPLQFSGRQLAIVAALGLSRDGRRLSI
nr:MAG: hypothetical protein 1 [Leviviridae sp.]